MQQQRMLLGQYSHTLDDKGRVTIPAKFRDVFFEGCVITRGWDHCLIIYTPEAFSQLVLKARRSSPTAPSSRALLRVLLSGANDAKLDKLGRVNIPSFLRDYAGLEDEVVLAGVGDWIEIWNSDDWEGQLETVNDSEANAVRFSMFDLSLGSSADLGETADIN